ncbi:SurA N-terminal domain-containing protein [Spirillospora sp. NPDC048911]|uniref:SurA N-terminal domain-containing protein n=1 Tax=Spirillospora sp. NPDC048911 TaxID=3364527 RepID=UPI003712B39F
MLGKVVKATLAGAVLAGALAGCGGDPVKVGAAAVVGDDRITTARLDQAVLDCRRQFKNDQVANQVRAALESQRQQQPTSGEPADCSARSALDTMVNFRVAAAAAETAGVSVTESQVDRTIGLMSQQAPAESIVVALGMPKEFTRDVARMNAAQSLILQKLGADASEQSPATLQAQQQAVALFRQAADKLDIQVNPRFGSFDGNRLTVSPITTRLSATESGVR